MKTTLTQFQRNFRKAREAADRGDSVLVSGKHGDYVFQLLTAATDHPFVGLQGVFGAVKLPRGRGALHDKIRRRLSAKNGTAADVLADAATRMGDARLRIRRR